MTWMFVHPQLWSCDELVVNPTLLTVSTCSVTAVALLTPNTVTRVKMKEWRKISPYHTKITRMCTHVGIFSVSNILCF